MKTKLFGILNSIISYLIFAFIVFEIDYVLKSYSAKLGDTVCSFVFFIFVIFIFNSLTRLFCASKGELEEFLLNKPNEFSKEKEICSVIKSFGYLSSVAVCLIMLIILPTDIFSFHIAHFIPLNAESMFEKTITVLLLLVLLASVSLFARISVREKMV